MNKQRRETIQKIRGIIRAAQASLEEQLDAIQSIIDEEQEYYDNMPESFQGGEKGDAASTVIGELESAHEELTNVVSSFLDLDSYMDNATQGDGGRCRTAGGIDPWVE